MHPKSEWNVRKHKIQLSLLKLTISPAVCTLILPRAAAIVISGVVLCTPAVYMFIFFSFTAKGGYTVPAGELGQEI